MIRAVIHYILAIFLLTIYGGQICPFLESLSAVTLGGIIATGLSVAFLVRFFLLLIVVDSTHSSFQVKRQFIVELAVFVGVGLVIASFNTFFYSFPFGSGLKLTIGCLFLGLFAASDMALARERFLATRKEWNEFKQDNALKFYPLTRKLVYAGSSLTVLTTGVLILVILHDFDWIGQLPANEPIQKASQSVIIEIIFVLGVILSYVINLICSYAKNIKVYFDRQTNVLKTVAKGTLDEQVLITTNDEFAVIGKYTNNMIAELKERADTLAKTQAATIRALASLAETRDNETGQHIIRTQNYVKVLSVELKGHERFRDFLDDETIDLLFESAPLHDVGKVGVPDRILLKPGKLTDEEFEKMKKHTIYGRDALKVAELQLGKDSFLRIASEIAYSHHEKWDGKGYPLGLKGEEIPVSGRLMALADVYDALISRRVYKPPFSHEKAYAIILDGRGSHFDVDVVDAFVRCENVIREIASRYGDSQQ